MLKSEEMFTEIENNSFFIGDKEKNLMSFGKTRDKIHQKASEYYFLLQAVNKMNVPDVCTFLK